MAAGRDPGGQRNGLRDEPTEITAPAIDLYEDKNDIVVKAELPGIDKDNIEVNLTDHITP